MTAKQPVTNEAEQRKKIRESFLRCYNNDANNHSNKTPFDLNGDSYDEINNLILGLIVENIDSGNETAESAMNFILIFIYTNLEKITTDTDGNNVIASENMPRNLSQEEKDFMVVAMDELILVFQIAVEHSSLANSPAADDWDLDMNNFVKKFAQAESIKFDKHTSPIELYRNLYRTPQA